MKKICLMAFLAFIVATLSLHAQDNTVLWKISGNGLEKDSYLLGTIHIMCAEDYELKEKIKKVIQEVDAVTLEVNLDSEENKAMLPEMMKPDPNFLTGLTASEITQIDSTLNTKHLSIKMLDMMSPAVFVSLLSLQSMNCTDPRNIKTMETDIQAIAASSNKKVDELETLKFQMDMLTKMLKAPDLLTYIKKIDEMPAISKKMVVAYKAENLKELETIIYESSYMSKEEQADFLTKRNENWMTQIPSKIKDSSHLIAVGAGHLIGEKGLIKLLKDKGYTLTPIL
ncbi:TraB/GumN family protein [Sphingobacterium sp. SRCM116780]|uniref:TraB/GumN family protein n=1 Tax=Sphingobacterium sp. SRCM116780 TaxID=2907623 RepID=UPI001F199906|nr:TraB/GumN family protein [Sphingobacterium sp. SRCM116780]UIR57536.1 TraB/GumN family protein [Sphingobacterium sp. SRCM116780]